MNEQMRESISALVDNETNELELERVLARIGSDEDMRQTWVRYNLAREALAGQQLAHSSFDISQRVRAEIGDANAAKQTSASSLGQRLFRPVASLAVAASVAATVVIGGQQLAGVSGEPYMDNQPVVASALPVGMVNSLGATSVQASYGTQSLPVLLPATRTAYKELARQRMGKYMQEHAEQAALNTPQGLIPFARVPQIEQ